MSITVTEAWQAKLPYSGHSNSTRQATMSHPIGRLLIASKPSIFFHRYKANHLVTASLGFIVLACPCSKLLAGNPFSTPVAAEFAGIKTTKEPGCLDDLINHNAYIRQIPPFVFNPNTTHFIFAMNHENERGEKKDEYSEEPEGAEAQQLKPLMEIPLPPMNHAQITAIIQGLNTGFDEDTLNTMLSYIPVTLPDESLTIASMIKKVQQALHVEADNNQNAMIEVLTNIVGTESPVDMTKPEDQLSLVILMMSYYTAIHSNGATPQVAHAFFDSFLFHATDFSGIKRLHARKAGLLGTIASIKDHEILKANIKESASVFSGLKLLGEMRLKILQQLDNLPEAEISEASVDPMLLTASSLLNYGIDKNLTPLYQHDIKSAEQILMLIQEYVEKNPESVASNIKFMSFLYSSSLILGSFIKKMVLTQGDNMSINFSNSDVLAEADPVIDAIDTVFKKLTLSAISEEVRTDSKKNTGNENPELFRKWLLALENHISTQLQKTFIDKNDYTLEMLSICSTFDLLESYTTKAMYRLTTDNNANEQADGAKQNKTAKGQEGKEFSNEEKKKKIKHLKARKKCLDDFEDWFKTNFDYSVDTLYGSENVEAVRASFDASFDY
ncbi:hypothetical protein [Endozoicomonas sp. ONNA1]|uniref:hypothetical protein n=1 Tax=Endozoicomonas sp. ONNA1 TaxID=2828740 RepID=UPI0021482C69|nr:hypothetical protein [Endozoicomonas sp. ONNA1]